MKKISVHWFGWGGDLTKLPELKMQYRAGTPPPLKKFKRD